MSTWEKLHTYTQIIKQKVVTCGGSGEAWEELEGKREGKWWWKYSTIHIV